jgi:hypothetical protein
MIDHSMFLCVPVGMIVASSLSVIGAPAGCLGFIPITVKA